MQKQTEQTHSRTLKTIQRRIEEKEELIERGKEGNDPTWSSDKKHALRSKKEELEELQQILKK